jgi:carbonic anhydrase
MMGGHWGGKTMLARLQPAFALALPLFLLTSGALLAIDEEFCYEGDGLCLPPAEWPGICVSGNNDEQSPVDIRDTATADLPILIADYQEGDAITVITNGHTLEVAAHESDRLRVVGTKHCELLQFHFHASSEHWLGGVSFPAEVHLVHRCDDGGLLVIGVLLDYLNGEPNRALGAALEHAARDQDGNFIEGETTTRGVRQSAEDLLPPTDSRGYFNYPGSLTTPPCSEVVDWHVLKTPVSVSEEQVEDLMKLLSDTSPDGASFNNRPIQDLGARTILRRGASLPF